jgi:hypothetical protein
VLKNIVFANDLLMVQPNSIKLISKGEFSQTNLLIIHLIANYNSNQDKNNLIDKYVFHNLMKNEKVH